MQVNWYEVINADQVDSPALLVYPDRIRHNIQTMVDMVGGQTDRLIPHVKTHKMAEVMQMQVEADIRKFKCATIAEAEMLAHSGAEHVLLAYQLTGPKISRFRELVQANPQVDWASLVDNAGSAAELGRSFAEVGRRAVVYIDVNNGMNRTGHPINNELEALYRLLTSNEHLDVRGFHVYDGHLRDADFAARKASADAALQPVQDIIKRLVQDGSPQPVVIAGGTPTFSVHAPNEAVWCSPGTCLLWDWGYGDLLAEQSFQWAALLLTRVISKPAPGIITTDLGHKAVAAENPLPKRVQFLNLTNYEAISQSEEHLVLRVDNWDAVQVGDVLYGVPYHICPTVALHEEVTVVQDGRYTDEWTVVARKRKLTV